MYILFTNRRNNKKTMKNLFLKNYDNKGFTLVEMAIVLVIIGLILGMVFKGKELIDGAKVKNLAAQYNKILAATNTFYERYGFYPGDGCPSATPATVATCNGTKNGLLTTANEQGAFWYLMIDVTGIMPAADRKSVFGQDWDVWYGAIGGLTANWLDLPGGAQADPRLSCALDRLIDDAASATGFIRTDGTAPTWTNTTDCWTLSGQVNIVIKILP